MGQKPTRMTQKQIEDYRYQTSTKIPGGIFGPIQAGLAYMGPEGKRLVLSAHNLQIVFLVGNAVYFQPTGSFVGDILTHPPIRGAQGAVGMACLAQTTIDLMIGVAAVVGPGGAAMLLN